MGEVVSFETERKRRRKHAGSFAWLGWLLVMLVSLALGFGFAQSAVFDIRSIEFNGNHHVSDEELLAISGLAVGEHIYAANLDRAETMLRTNLWVQQVSITRRLPATLVVDVTERVPAAAITGRDGLYILDATGMLLMKKRLLEGLSVIVLSGIDEPSESITPGTVLEGDGLDAAMAVIHQMDKDTAALVAEMDVADTQNITVHTSYGVDFYMGDKNDFMKKFTVGLQILQTEAEKGMMDNLKYIDVSLPEQPVLSYRH